MQDDTGPKEHAVRSDAAVPTRPGGYDGVRQPLASQPANPPPVQPADAVLAVEVAGALGADGRLGGTAIAVSAGEGRITLTGTVRVEFQRELATALASGVAGVLVVQNRLDVIEPGPPPGDATPL